MSTQAGIEYCHNLVDRAERRGAANSPFFIHHHGQVYERFNFSLYTLMYVGAGTFSKFRKFLQKLNACINRYNGYDYIDEEDEKVLDSFVTELVTFRVIVEAIVQGLKEKQAEERRLELDAERERLQALEGPVATVTRWRSGAAHRPGGIGYHVNQVDEPLGYFLGMAYHSFLDLQTMISTYNPDPDLGMQAVRVAVFDWSPPTMWEPEDPVHDPSPWGWGSISSGGRPLSNSFSEWDHPSTDLQVMQHARRDPGAIPPPPPVRPST